MELYVSSNRILINKLKCYFITGCENINDWFVLGLVNYPILSWCQPLAALLLGSSVETNIWTMARKQGTSSSQGAGAGRGWLSPDQGISSIVPGIPPSLQGAPASGRARQFGHRCKMMLKNIQRRLLLVPSPCWKCLQAIESIEHLNTKLITNGQFA